MNTRLIKDMIAGVISELETCALQVDANMDACLRHAERAKKSINEVEYEIWHSVYTSGTPYGKQSTEAWK